MLALCPYCAPIRADSCIPEVKRLALWQFGTLEVPFFKYLVLTLVNLNVNLIPVLSIVKVLSGDYRLLLKFGIMISNPWQPARARLGGGSARLPRAGQGQGGPGGRAGRWLTRVTA
jgi:hypothetical protein